jgi:hypothetical protein
VDYILTVTIEPAGMGGVDLSPNGEYVSPGKAKFPAGTVVSMFAIFFGTVGQFDHWAGNASGTQNPTTITMNSDKSVTAVFIVGGKTRELTTSVIGQGAVYPSSGTFNLGDKIIIIAVPSSGWSLSSWSGDVDGCSQVPGYPNNLSVPMTKNRHIIATFITETPVGETEFRNLTVTYWKQGG